MNAYKHDEVAEWLRRWTANPLGSARVGSNPILVVGFYGVMVSTLDSESSDPSSNLGRTFFSFSLACLNTHTSYAKVPEFREML